jgi:hypothetical protein
VDHAAYNEMSNIPLHSENKMVESGIRSQARVGGPPVRLRRGVQAGRQPVPKQLVIEGAIAPGGANPHARGSPIRGNLSVCARCREILHAGCKDEGRD